MRSPSTKSAYAIAIAGGALLWLATMAVSGRNEAWDSVLYWTIAYPLSVALATYLGYACPKGAWRWPLAVTFSQALVMISIGSGFALLPLGLILFGILALPPLALALLAAGWRLRREKRPKN